MAPAHRRRTERFPRDTRSDANHPREWDLHGVHVVRFRWGRVTELQAYPDTEKFSAFLRRLAAAGVVEAAAPPIES